MSQYKILALDIDGTLMNSKKEITPAVHEAIRELQDRNIPVLIASGRPARGIYHVADMLDMKERGGYILSFNGGKIINYQTMETVYSKPIDPKYFAEIAEVAAGFECSLVTYDGDNIITEKPNNPYSELESRVVRMPLKKVDNLLEVLEEKKLEVNKFLMVGEPELLAVKVKEVQKRFEGRLNVFLSEPFFIEVVPLGIDKATSLAVMLEKYGLTRENLVACGDGGNDVTMVDFAGMGVAMENACQPVKDVANFITKSCDEDGVAVAIKKFF